ncbi:MAG: hypothetical protein ACR2LY_06970 [Thermoleophilaceae bacterium]
METLVFKVAAHAGIEAVGGLGVGCMLLLCHHEHFHGRLAFVNRIVHSRAYRAGMVGLFWLATSLATVLVVDPEVLAEGLAVFTLAVGLHLALETAGGAGLMAAAGLRRGSLASAREECGRPDARTLRGGSLRSRMASAGLLAAWYLAFAVAAVTLIPFGHGG